MKKKIDKFALGVYPHSPAAQPQPPGAKLLKQRAKFHI